MAPRSSLEKSGGSAERVNCIVKAVAGKRSGRSAARRPMARRLEARTRAAVPSLRRIRSAELALQATLCAAERFATESMSVHAILREPRAAQLLTRILRAARARLTIPCAFPLCMMGCQYVGVPIVSRSAARSPQKTSWVAHVLLITRFAVPISLNQVANWHAAVLLRGGTAVR